MTYFMWLGRKAEKYHRRDQIAERVKAFTSSPSMTNPYIERDGYITYLPKL